jgi:predicted nucleic-acid-binding protein
MRAVDTNVLVRLLTRDDEKQAASADDFIQGGAWVSHLVLLETSWVLTSVYDVTSKQLMAALEMLLQHESLVIQDADVVSSALGLFKENLSLGFSGCLVLEVARKAGHLPLGTFDKQLGKVDGAHRL